MNNEEIKITFTIEEGIIDVTGFEIPTYLYNEQLYEIFDNVVTNLNEIYEGDE